MILKPKKILFLALLLSTACAPVHINDLSEADRNRILSRISQNEPITGAFGYEFGEVFNLQDATGTVTDTIDNHWFEPKDPYVDFTSYSVHRAPITGVVASVNAFSDKMSKNVCLQKLDTLKTLLFRKYGQYFDRDVGDQLRNSYTFSNGGGVAIIRCSGFIDYRLLAKYFSYGHVGQAEEERVSLDTDNANKNGL